MILSIYVTILCCASSKYVKTQGEFSSLATVLSGYLVTEYFFDSQCNHKTESRWFKSGTCLLGSGQSSYLINITSVGGYTYYQIISYSDSVCSILTSSPPEPTTLTIGTCLSTLTPNDLVHAYNRVYFTSLKPNVAFHSQLIIS